MQPKNYNGWQDLQTFQSKEILSELMEAKSYQAAKLLISDTGAGKSNTIKLFKHAKPDHTYVITVGDSYRLVDVVHELMRLLDLHVQYKRDMHMIREKLSLIAEKLQEIRKKGGKPVIIIDEAENLKPQVLKMIKELYDAIIRYCSIVLIGTEQIMDSILNRKSKNRQSVPQLWRRFKAGTRYISKIDKARDFKPFFDLYIATEPDVQDILLDVCDNYGELHDYLDPVLRHCAEKNVELSEKTFRLFHKLPKQSLTTKMKRA